MGLRGRGIVSATRDAKYEQYQGARRARAEANDSRRARPSTTLIQHLHRECISMLYDRVIYVRLMISVASGMRTDRNDSELKDTCTQYLLTITTGDSPETAQPPAANVEAPIMLCYRICERVLEY
jgi:hypothetical protein